MDLDPARLQEAAGEIAARAAVPAARGRRERRREEDVQRAVAQALEATGAIHGVVNVAGITRDARIPKKSFADFQAVLAVHLQGTFLFMREVAAQHWHALYKENGSQPLDDGANRFVVNFSSVQPRQGNVGQVDYTAAKGAIESLTKTAAREFSAYRARVNAIAPAPVRTPMLAAIGDAGVNARWPPRRSSAASPSRRRSPPRSPRSPIPNCSGTRRTGLRRERRDVPRLTPRRRSS